MTPAARERLHVRMPLFAVSGAAWLWLVAQPHVMHRSPVRGSVLMFAAMMVPLLGPPLRHVRDRSLARRRVRAIAWFTGIYALLWIAAGVAMIWIAQRVHVGIAVVAIASWQCSPAKQRCLNRCHAHRPLSAFGAAADLDALRFGFNHGLWCIGSCLGLMLLPMLFSHYHLAATAIATLWLAGERLEKPLAPRWRLRGPGKTLRILAGRARLWLHRDDHFPTRVAFPQILQRP